MAFNFDKFCRDYRIDSATSGNKHARSGWIQVHCPFCVGSKNYHLGFSINADIFTCYRCGRGDEKGKNRVVAKLLGIELSDAIEIVDRYTSGTVSRSRPRRKARVRRRKSANLPAGTTDMADEHRAYLRKRGFNPEELEQVWGLLGTGRLGDYRRRIIIPINLDGDMVSYQGRDITGRSDIPYKACPQDEEAVDHQSILYGLDLIQNRSAVVVEGVADCWRLGAGAVACFGISFTTAQVNELAKRLDRAFIMFDAEPEAQEQANALGARLAARGVAVEIVEIDEGDPGELPQDEADRIMTELLG